MKRLKILIFIFCLALSIPLAYLVLLTYHSLEQEEMAELQYFADTMFDEMEKALTVLILREEKRAVDEYDFYYTPPENYNPELDPPSLSQTPDEDYILGYFQNNPDGAFQTPLVRDIHAVAPQHRDVVAALTNINNAFNRKRTDAADTHERPAAPRVQEVQEEKGTSLAANYLKLEQSEKPKERLGLEKKQVQNITPRQALAFKKRDKSALEPASPYSRKTDSAKSVAQYRGAPDSRLNNADAKSDTGFWNRKSAKKNELFFETEAADTDRESNDALDSNAGRLKVEVAPMQSVFINDKRIFLFRRIIIDNLIYRQGLVIRADEFLNHLANQYFASQPMAQFTHLQLEIADQRRRTAWVKAGVTAGQPKFTLSRVFPRPFSFLHGKLTCERIPETAGRKTLTIMLTVLAVIILLGFFAIYQSARTVVDMSERRSEFVSSVTHELKTPLTNIRMYIEMLEQGIAPTREREQEYFRILDSESARLSRLINNVLEFSKLEKKELRPDLKQGTFEEVIARIKEVISEKLHQEGFKLITEHPQTDFPGPFTYDREMMILVLINLIENSIKFGRTSAKKEITLRVAFKGECAKISVSDTGPGVPCHALNKIFDDFYRADSSITRTTRGAGIGLAFVKKCITACGGKVSAANNDGAGCTIMMTLPVRI